jgi:hypothetical protein
MLLTLGLEEGFAKRPEAHTFSGLEEKNVEQERQRTLLNVCLQQTALFKLQSEGRFLQLEIGRTIKRRASTNMSSSARWRALFGL